MTRSPTYMALGVLLGFTALCALLFGTLALGIDDPLVGGLLPRGQLIAVSLLYGTATLAAAVALWTQGPGLVRVLSVWATVATIFQIWFPLMLRVDERGGPPLPFLLLGALPFMALPWALVWFIRNDRRARATAGTSEEATGGR